MSSIPLGENLIHIQRGLTTSSTAVFVPFTVQELFQSGEALYYGLNALSNNMILCDRKKLKNPNGLILGTPGSGKSFSAKREITNAFLITSDDMLFQPLIIILFCFIGLPNYLSAAIAASIRAICSLSFAACPLTFSITASGAFATKP